MTRSRLARNKICSLARRSTQPMFASRLQRISQSIIVLPFVRDVLRVKLCPNGPATSQNPGVRALLRPWTLLGCAVLLLCWPIRSFAQTSVVAPVGLQSWWPGESNFNDIRGANSGTNAGGVSFVPGEVGQTFHFDGSANSYFTVPNSATFAPASNQVTIAAWVRPNYTASNVVDTVFSKRDACGFNRSYILDITKAGLVPFGYPLGSIVWSASVAGDDAISTVPVPNDGLYHFIVGTYDGANMNVYLDGVLVGQKPHTGPIPVTSDLPYVGKQSGCGDLTYADIDELQFYNRSLSQSEISAIYDAANAGVSQNAPVPQINQPTAPATATPGGAAFTLTVNGTGFVPGASVNWNGSPRSTTFVSNTQVTGTIPATDIAASGTASVTVFNPSTGGGTSNVVFVEITVASASVGFGLSGDFGAGGTLSWNIIVGDFNGDGKLDLAVATSGDNTISVLVGNGDGTFGPPVNSLTNFFPNSITSGDFNGDGKLDLAVAKGNTNTVAILIGNGDGHFQAPVEYSVGQSPKSVTVGDFNSDGNLDIAVANQNSNTISVLLGKGDGTFGAAIDYPTGAVPVYLVAGDFNRDGAIDLVVANQSSDTVSVLLGKGDGTFTSAVDFSTGTAPTQLNAADLNGDGILDLAVVNQSAGTVSILSGAGDGTFGSHVDYAAPANVESLTVADLNGDGKLDLVTGSGGFFSVFFGNGDGTFQPRRDSQAPFSHHPGIVVADFNNDGRLDSVVSDPETNRISIFLQSPDATLSSSSLAFGAQNVGTPSLAQSVTLTSTGSFPLHIVDVALTGTNFADFSETDNCVSSSPIAVGNTCTISITFAPSAIGSRSASLQITDDASDNPQTISLSGTGIAPLASLSPANLSFGNQGISTASAPKTVTLTNTGNTSLSVANITASAGFSQTNNCPASLAPAANCTINVIFNPTLTGAAVGAVTITDNAVNSPQSVTLSGTGVTSIVAPVGLQSWWPGESNFNDIRGANSGTNAGGVSFVPGEVGQAFHFDGAANSYFTVPNSATFAPASNQVTIAAWVRPNYTASNVVDTVFSKRDACGFNRSYILDITKAGLVPFGYTLGSIVWSASVAGDDAISTVPVPNDGLYHFIVGTYDGANMNVYLDGVLVGQKPRSEE